MMSIHCMLWRECPIKVVCFKRAWRVATITNGQNRYPSVAKLHIKNLIFYSPVLFPSKAMTGFTSRATLSLQPYESRSVHSFPLFFLFHVLSAFLLGLYCPTFADKNYSKIKHSFKKYYCRSNQLFYEKHICKGASLSKKITYHCKTSN